MGAKTILDSDLDSNSVESIVKNVDREGNELRIGDRVGFIMRGWFLPREQESFGVIVDIDKRGGISIEVIESYRRFSSAGRVVSKEKLVYFIHHVYDSEKRQRVYSKQENGHLLSIFRVELDEMEWHMKEAEEAETRRTDEVKAASRAAFRKGR